MTDADSKAPLVVLGAGGHGKVVADIVLATGATILGFLDDRVAPGSRILGLPVLGPLEWLTTNPARVALGVGDNLARARAADVIQAAGASLATAIHPRAVVSPFARIEEGTVVMALAVVNPDAIVQRGAILNTASVVEHDCRVGAFAHISPNGALAGGCHVGAQVHLGIGASMLPGTRVGDRSIIGGGALVARNLPPDVVASGVPARVLRHLTTGSG
ncbi:4-amino-6-deoxy-N-Acetyl-D-hexosaminyl-(Lipid carrier) acetyltrasferase [Labilithrix luteola]|uniref:4-amino-6-deoxy-N-Acetyl-D-hexosaminyl-(Lipid carrier) acetyltrasferase n=1 Tax=Labilithrix luteola TaxID=1391654 RepID=A0A0K1Q600_9BACT|nr:acetyltransferase [Labilithrix luteola]AKV01163.1 4-amino-6-deoxy-N-Acetyl-D-hexosaminyl-(Lipid carrier) acetyltrasferase [Labilithrix luteola]